MLLSLMNRVQYSYRFEAVKRKRKGTYCTSKYLHSLSLALLFVVLNPPLFIKLAS